MEYYIAVASKDHVHKGVEGGFMQANHGKSSSLKKLKKEDWIIFYSSKLEYGKEEKCQCFTAIGQIKDEELYQGFMTSEFQPFRKNVNFYEAKEVSILPLIGQLDFIPDKKRWGFPFRFGFLKISEKDFEIIRNEMLENN